MGRPKGSRAKSATSWWDKATDEARIQQIRGAIDCGMTARTLAANCGLPPERTGSVTMFAFRNGLHFNSDISMRDYRRCGMTSGIVSARNKGVPDFEITSAFQIFRSS